MIKLITIDIDGTLVTSTKRLTNRTKIAIKKAEEQGLYIALASGRPFSGMYPYLKELNLIGDHYFSVTQNGAYIHKNDTGEAIIKNCMMAKDLDFVDKRIRPFGLQMSYMDSKYFYTRHKAPNIYTILDSVVARRRLRYMPYNVWDSEKTFGRFLVMGPSYNITKLERNVPKDLLERYYCVRTERFLFEIISKNANKGTGVQELAYNLGFKKEEVMAFGNELNDIPMLEFAGLSVAMGNSKMEVKEISDYVTKSNNKDGVAIAIEKLLENNKIDFTKNS